MKKVFVRIPPKKQNATFCRCGIQFTKDWMEVDADDATLSRLKTEQMLEVTEEVPDGFIVEAKADGDGDGDGDGEGKDNGKDDSKIESKTPPTDAIERITAIKAAIKSLDKSKPDLFTKDGKPQVEAISEITGFYVSAVERDAALQEIAKGK